MLQIYKFFNAKASLINNSAERTLGYVFSRMIRHNSSSMSFRVVPDFVAAFRMTVKHKPSLAKCMNYFRCFKSWKAAHLSTGTGIFTSSLKCGFWPMVRFFGIESPFSMQDSIILRATSSAISMVSAIVLPWAIRPWRTGLVARYSPSSKYSIEIGIRYSDIDFSPPIKSITQGVEGVNHDCRY